MTEQIQRIQEAVHCRVNVRIDVRDATTRHLLRRQRHHNLVVLAGRNMVRDALYGDIIVSPNRMALGTGSTAVTPADTALATEVWRDLLSNKAKGSGVVTMKYFLSSTTANGNTLREAGLVNNVLGQGELFARVVYADIVKTASITVLFVWTITIGAS